MSTTYLQKYMGLISYNGLKFCGSQSQCKYDIIEDSKKLYKNKYIQFNLEV